MLKHFILSILMTLPGLHQALAQDCLLSENSEENPAVILTGETHLVPEISGANPEAILDRNSLKATIKRALKGDFFLALEGPSYGHDTVVRAHVNAILKDEMVEDPQYYWIEGLEEARVYELVDYGMAILEAGKISESFFSRKTPDPNPMLQGQIRLFSKVRDGELTREAFDNVFGQREFIDEYSMALELIKNYVDHPGDLESFLEAKRTAVRLQPNSPSSLSLFDILDSHQIIFSQMTALLYLADLDTSVEPPPSLFSAMDGFTHFDYMPFLCQITTGYRTQIFAERVERLLCRAKKAGKNIVVRTGSLHTEGLAVALQEKLGSKIQIDVPSPRPMTAGQIRCLKMANQFDRPIF